MKRIDADCCVIGAGITGALAAEKLSEEFDGRIVIVERGPEFPFEDRARDRARWLAYGDSPFPGDKLEDDIIPGSGVGGAAMHWMGVAPRFTSEDLRTRSLYGIGTDWPMSYDELEPWYGEAERRIGVSGAPHPADDPRSEPFPMEPEPLDSNLAEIGRWFDRAGVPWVQAPFARNTRPYRGRPACVRCDTCHCCPIGAKYSPDFTLGDLRRAGKIELYPRTTVRRLETDETGRRIVEAAAVDEETGREVRFRARVFALAGGVTWAPHLLLVSRSDRFPEGLANRSGLVGRFLTGHANFNASYDLPAELVPGHRDVALLTDREFMRASPGRGPARFDVTAGVAPRFARLRDGKGRLQLREQILAGWRASLAQGHVNVHAHVHVLPARDSRVGLHPQKRNRWGDPVPTWTVLVHEDSIRTFPGVAAELQAFGARLAVGGAVLTRTSISSAQGDALAPEAVGADTRLKLTHLAGGCRMGVDPADSVCDASGRTHDHENLYVLGAPLLPTGGCTNGTLTFVALALRTARRLGEDWLRQSPK